MSPSFLLLLPQVWPLPPRAYAEWRLGCLVHHTSIHLDSWDTVNRCSDVPPTAWLLRHLTSSFLAAFSSSLLDLVSIQTAPASKMDGLKATLVTDSYPMSPWEVSQVLCHQNQDHIPFSSLLKPPDSHFTILLLSRASMCSVTRPQRRLKHQTSVERVNVAFYRGTLFLK